MTEIKSPEDLQTEAVTYFRSLKAPVKLDVWAIEEVAGERCADGNCHRVGFVSIDNSSDYCVGHASILVMASPTDSLGMLSLDIVQPVIVPDELTAGEDLLELVRNYLYFIADHKGSNVTVFMYERATALGNRCSQALKARTTARGE